MTKVSLFIPCIVDIFMPQVGLATMRLLRRIGIDPVYHEAQTCCGQPALNAGYRRHARRAAKHFIELFGGDDLVVSPAGSCVAMVKNHYPELLEGEPSWRRRAEELSPRVYELSQYIMDVLGVEELGASFRGSVAYHESCHILRELGVSRQPKVLIENTEGATLVPLNQADRCCGFGGEFAARYAFISEELVKEKAGHYLVSGADLLLLSEPGCLLNIGGYLDRNHPWKRVMHLAEFLAGPDVPVAGGR